MVVFEYIAVTDHTNWSVLSMLWGFIPISLLGPLLAGWMD